MKELQEFRKKIDALDDQILALLGKRYGIVRQVGQLKADKNLALVQHDRVREVLERVAVLAADNGLDPAFVQSLYTLMIDHAHDIESGYRTSHAAA